MLNRWTYGWFGQPAASNQTVQKSQDQSHLQTSQAGRSSQQLDPQYIRPTTRVGLLEGSEWKGNGGVAISQTSADSFKTAPDGYGPTRASDHHQVRFEEASSNRPLQPVGTRCLEILLTLPFDLLSELQPSPQTR